MLHGQVALVLRQVSHILTDVLWLGHGLRSALNALQCIHNLRVDVLPKIK